MEDTRGEAPVIQLLLTASFAPTLDMLSIIDIADLYALFSDEYPVFTQVERAGPMSYTPLDEGLQSDGTGMPRVAFASSDLSRNILFQEDRISVGWAKSTVESGPSYPGFGAVADQLDAAIRKIVRWSERRGLPAIVPAAGEVLYVDGFLRESDESSPKRLSEIFTFLNPSVTFPRFAFNYSWHENLPGDLEGYALITALGQTVFANGNSGIILQTTISFNPGAEWSALESRFEKAHQAAVAIFERLVTAEARAIS